MRLTFGSLKRHSGDVDAHPLPPFGDATQSSKIVRDDRGTLRSENEDPARLFNRSGYSKRASEVSK
jgi:hypothetical protein